RALPSFSALTIIAALATSACGGSTPAPAAPSEAPAPEAPVQADATPGQSKAAAGDDEAWVGEKTTVSSEGNEPSAAGADRPPADRAPVEGKAAETRTMDVIRKLVMDNRKAARKCYDDARRDQKDLKGDVVIHFVLNPEGKVKLAELNQERSTLNAQPVVDCVIGVIKSIPFPRSSRAMETSTNYPFNFTP
ncbi:MAG: AgmX/PglI C-terminal domain-containing protein, partial [Polyangiaceae bacterium]